MKYVLTIAVTLCTLCYCAPFKKAVSQKSSIPLTTEPVTLADKFAVLNEFAVHLATENKISINAEKMAKILIIVLYSESGLKTSATDGIFQVTPQTRKRFHYPEMKGLPFTKQIEYLKDYLEKSGHLYDVKSTTDLHVIIFAPARFNAHKLSGVSGKLAALDYNNDGQITRTDLQMFDKCRAMENKFIKNLYFSLEV